MTKKITLLTIKRSEWAHGGTNKIPTLDPQDNKGGEQCCLGFLREACKIPITNYARTPGDHVICEKDENGEYLLNQKLLKMWPEGIFTKDGKDETIWTKTAMEINDKKKIDMSTREQQLKKHFKKIGITLKFVD